MTLALRSPHLVKALVPVDNAPAQAVLNSDFSKYIVALRHITKARVSRQVEADAILKIYEKVGHRKAACRWKEETPS